MTPYSVLEEAVNEDLTREWVERRIEDWAWRIEKLYRDIESWLPAGWTTRRGPPYAMRANLLEKFGLGQRELPTLELVRDGVVRGRVYPQVLWIIGANGRLDIFIDGENHYISDYARIFEPADWQIAPADDPTARRALGHAELQELLAR